MRAAADISEDLVGSGKLQFTGIGLKLRKAIKINKNINGKVALFPLLNPDQMPRLELNSYPVLMLKKIIAA